MRIEKTGILSIVRLSRNDQGLNYRVQIEYSCDIKPVNAFASWNSYISTFMNFAI